MSQTPVRLADALHTVERIVTVTNLNDGELVAEALSPSHGGMAMC